MKCLQGIPCISGRILLRDCDETLVRIPKIFPGVIPTRERSCRM